MGDARDTEDKNPESRKKSLAELCRAYGFRNGLPPDSPLVTGIVPFVPATAPTYVNQTEPQRPPMEDDRNDFDFVISNYGFAYTLCPHGRSPRQWLDERIDAEWPHVYGELIIRQEDVETVAREVTAAGFTLHRRERKA